MDRLPVLYPIWCLDRKPVCECVQEAADAGFDGVSFMGAQFEDPRRLDTLGEREAAELRDTLARLGLMCTLHVASDTYFSGMASRDADTVERAQQSIEGCVRALTGEGTPLHVVSLDPICLPTGAGAVVNTELIAEMLEFLISLAGRYGVRPAVENWVRPEIGSPEALTSFFSAIEGEAGILLDMGHVNMALKMEWCREKTPEEFIRHLPAPVVEVHLHDNHGAEDEHLPAGYGTADFPAMLGALLKTGFHGPITLETDLREEGRPGLAAGLETARALCAAAQDQTE